MSEHKHEQKVKDVRVDNDNLCIELLNGLLLIAPMRTNPVRREAVAPANVPPPAHLVPAMGA